MNDEEFMATLKRKRESHLNEINKLQRLVENIDNLMAEYSSDIQGVTQGEIGLALPKENIDINSLNITEAILYIMKSNPGRPWRGTEIYKALRKRNYKEINNLAQKISARLAERSQAATGRWKRTKGEDGYPRYVLRAPEKQGSSL